MSKRALGIDGYRNGWLCVWLDENGERGYEAIRHISEIEKFNALIVMIDIPIGLPASGYRVCDIQAREILSSGRSRVFLGARRFLLGHLSDYAEANATAKQDGRGISRQLFCILPKIAEVDSAVARSNWNQNFFRECHPELAFHRLNGNHLMDNKKSKSGEMARIRLLETNGIPEIREWASRLPTKARLDDLLDASVCALVARSVLDNQGMKVGGEERDEVGLRMEIWY